MIDKPVLAEDPDGALLSAENKDVAEPDAVPSGSTQPANAADAAAQAGASFKPLGKTQPCMQYWLHSYSVLGPQTSSSR